MFFLLLLFSFTLSANEVATNPVTGDYINDSYVNLRKINNTEFTFEANGGENPHYNLSKAFDDDLRTYWLSNTPNSDSFTNNITINFDKLTTLEAILYDTAYITYSMTTPPNRTYLGYPTKLNVYALKTNIFDLVATFTGEQEYPTTRVQFVFPTPVTCKQLRLDFDEITNNTFIGGFFPMISNIIFLKYVPPVIQKTEAVSGNYDDLNYVNLRKIRNTEFKAEVNGCSQSLYPLSYAFDNNNDLYWVSNTPNSDFFTNILIISFKKLTTLEAFLYDTAYETNGNIRTYYGYPTQLNVYALSLTNRYEFVATFTGNHEYPTTKVQFVFPTPVKCKKLRLEFVDVTTQSMPDISAGLNPVIGELTLLRYAPIVQTVDPEGKFLDIDYISQNQVSRDAFNLLANGGESSLFPLSNAFDGLNYSYWVSDRENSKDFTNTLTFEFNDTFLIEAFIYDAACNSSDSTNNESRELWGYPTKLNVYSANENNEFQLSAVFVGNHFFPSTRILFAFPFPIYCTKMRLEFIVITPQFLEGNASKVIIDNLLLIKKDDRIPISMPSGNYSDELYINQHRIPQDSFVVTSNGGEYNENRKLEYGFDNKINTWHISGIPNSDNFTNTFTIDFLEIQTLDAFLYYPAFFTNTSLDTGFPVRRFEGFPTTLKVYTSLDKNDFELVAIFAGLPAYPMTWIQYVFPTPITCKKIRLCFIEVTDVSNKNAVSSPGKYAFFSEISFIKSNENFSYSDVFIQCDVFSISEIFTRSDVFSESDIFSKSDVFTKSDIFAKSDAFSYSNAFSKSDVFSESDIFTKSNVFSYSDAFSKSDFFTKSDVFSESDLFPSCNFTRSSEFTISEYFTKSKEFTSSLIFSQSKSFTKEIQTNPAVLTSLSISYSISFVSVKSVSFSLSYVSSNIFMMSFLEEENTYYMSITQNYYVSYFPYIIQYLSPVSVSTFIRMVIPRKNRISPEQLIGVVCGSVSVFFLILGIIILVLRKKYYVNDFSCDFSLDSSSAENINFKKANNECNDETELGTTNMNNNNDENVINQKSDSEDNLDFWL